MKMDLIRLFDTVGMAEEIDCALDFSKESLYGCAPFQQPVRVTGKIENRAGVVRLAFSVKSVLSLTCDRCLKAFEKPVEYRFSHILVRELSGDDEDAEFIVCADGQLVLDELGRAGLLLELPTKVLCREDCKGLCPKCGKDLNFGPCDCKKEIDPRWQALSDLFPD